MLKQVHKFDILTIYLFNLLLDKINRKSWLTNTLFWNV